MRALALVLCAVAASAGGRACAWGGAARLFARTHAPPRPPTPPPPPLPLTFMEAALRVRGAWSTYVLRTDEPSEVAAARPLMCSMYADAILLQGSVLTLILMAGLFAFTLNRTRYVRRLKALSKSDNSSLQSFLSPNMRALEDAQRAGGTLPGVSVVLPCKGVHAQSYTNWKSQVMSEYGGQLEFIFCVESTEDPAHPKIKRLIQELGAHKIKLVVAGLSFHSSQKIHNQLAGISVASRLSAYLLIVDDDIQLHPGSVACWVAEMEADPSVFVASGYSFDYAPRDAMTLPTSLVMMWRMVAMSAFTHTRPYNLWGGAFMFRREELQRNVHGIVDAWRDGGYSEDLITIALCRKHRKAIAMPLAAIFPNRLSEPVSWERYWNYVTRQVFVLSTWAFPYHCYLAVQMQVTLIVHNGCIALGVALLLALAASGCALLAAAALAAATELATAGAPAGAVLCAAVRGAAGAAGGLAEPCGRTFLYALVQAAAFLGIGTGFKLGIDCLAELCNTLSPPAVGRDGRKVRRVCVRHVTIPRLLLAYWLHTFIVSAAYVRTKLFSAIVWSGVRFTISNGRVCRMERKDLCGQWYTLPRESSLQEALEEDARVAAGRLKLALDG
ncbi:hypothetical protein T492DRAFT_845794 [Pavlovales sp. CCMP2436]|nr:hypothetical protein T492DRAFT_845794 [Pavlovales sp. CCMP2436]